MYKRGYIAARHPASTPIGMKRDRLERTKHNHRAVVANVETVHPDWYSPMRTRNARTILKRDLIQSLPFLAQCIKYHEPTDADTLAVAVSARHSVVTALNSLYDSADWMKDDTDELKVSLVNEPDGEKYVEALGRACDLVCSAAEAGLDYQHSLYQQLHDTLNELLEILAPEPDVFEHYQRQLEINTSYIDLMPPEPEPKKPRKTKLAATVESLMKEQRARRRQL